MNPRFRQLAHPPATTAPTREPSWADLTASPDKAATYAQDIYFREAWEELTVMAASPEEMLRPVALLASKPDGVVGRRLQPMLEFVVARGFRVIGVAEFHLDRHSMREIWRYDWHVYPVDRIAFCTWWYAAASSLVFFLEDCQALPGVPASVRLAAMKGNALAQHRRPDDLRSVLKPANRVLNFVHVPDEPADVVREIGIFFDSAMRRQVLAMVAGERKDCYEQAMQAIDSLQARVPAHDLLPLASLERLCSAGALDDAAAGELARYLRTGLRMSWVELLRLLPPDRPGVDRWDFITLASNLIPLERDVQGLLPSPGLSDWMPHEQVARA